MSNRGKAPEQLTPHVDADAFRSYAGSDWQPIPLHRWNDKSTDKRGNSRDDGKRPLDNAWTRLAYDTASVIARCAKEGRNMGVRLKADQLVIDVDPRNGGTEGFANLCLDLGLDPARWPRVVTGSGGDHFYLLLPDGVRVLDTLEGYAGVEFKSLGRQVVGAGSIHPNGKHYRWDDDFDRLELANAPAAPAELVEAIRRPDRSAEVTGGGQYTPEEIAKALDSLDASEFSSNDPWFRLMCACHHASNGDARSEWIEWSTSDPAYADDADMIGRRWDSLHKNKPQGITFRTLNKILADHGAANAQAKGDASGDFDAIEPEEDLDWLEGPKSEPPVKLSQVNANNIDRVFCLVNIGSKIRILYWGKSALDPRVRVPEFWPEEEFNRALANKFIAIETKRTDEEGQEKVETKRLPLARWWLTKKNRRTYDGLVFDADTEENSEHDEINLWRGFGVKENPDGDWSLMRDHIRTVIANEEEKSANYILRWLAWGFQNPTKQAEVALVFCSEGRGTGKGIVGRAVRRIYGGHGLHIAKRGLLTGRFNAHFMLGSFLFCDEALWPGHKEDEGALQTLISEPSMTIEPKGINAFMMPNALKVLMASNNPWVVPAAGDDRRYAVFEVSADRKQDHAYFGRIQKQLDNGGLGAMLHELRTWDLEGWHPRRDIPQTSALAAQKARSVKPELMWLAGFLDEGVLPFQHPSKPDRVEARAFYADARRSVEALRRWSDYEFAKFLESWGVMLKRSNGAWRVFPPLNEMRARWCEVMPWWPPFNPKVGDWRADI